jgi:hypothetical protein
MDPFYQQMMQQFGMQNELYPQFQFQQQPFQQQQLPMYDDGTSLASLNSVFGMPQVGGSGVNFGGYQQSYNTDQTGNYDYAAGNQQPTYGQPSTNAYGGADTGTGDYGGPQSYDSYGVYY